MGHFGDAVSATQVQRRRFGDGRFADGLQVDVIASKFFDLHTVSTLLNCSRKISTVSIFMATVTKKIFQTSTEKACLAFDCKYMSWSLPLRKLCHLVTPNACSRSPRGNLWPSAIRTRLLVGKNLLVKFGSTTGSRQNERTNVLLNQV